MKRILDVGQCGFDHSNISSFLTSHFEVTVDRAHAWSDTASLVKENDYDLILINRLLDRDGSEGMLILKELKASTDTADIPVMIISNYEDAQQTAIAAGALEGFGKSSLSSHETKEIIAQALGEPL